MKFPIIKIKDKASGYMRIVGTNSHDVLYVKDNTIRYLNLQNCEGTGVYGTEDFLKDLLRTIEKDTGNNNPLSDEQKTYIEKTAIEILNKRLNPSYSFFAPQLKDDEMSGSGYPEVDFVELDELLNIATDHLNEAMQNKIDTYRALKKDWGERMGRVMDETGIRGDTAGVLP